MNKIVLEAKDIKRTYTNGIIEVPALKKCAISIAEGEFVAVVGKSGSGKSTLLRILAGLDEPDGGEVWIDGKNIIDMGEREKAVFRRRKLGYVYQDYNLIPEFTAYENIALPLRMDGKREGREEVLGLLDTLGIRECEKKFSQEMSGGEQQRVSIARALVARPAVIFADEPRGRCRYHRVRRHPVPAGRAFYCILCPPSSQWWPASG